MVQRMGRSQTTSFHHLGGRGSCHRKSLGSGLWLSTVRWPLIVLGFAALGACGGDGGGSGTTPPPPPPPPPVTATLRLINAGWTDPPLNVFIDDKAIATNLDLGQAVKLSVTAGSHKITVYTDVPGVPTPTPIYGPAPLSFDANTSYVVAIEDSLTPADAAPVTVDVFPQPSGAVPAQSARIQVLAAYEVSGDELLVYVTAPGADLATSTPLGTLSFQQATDSTEVPAGQYEIRLVMPGSSSSSPPPYDSGTVTLGGGSDYSLVIVASGPLGQPSLLVDSVDAAARNYWLYPAGSTVGLSVVNDASGIASTSGFFVNGVNLFPMGVVSLYTVILGASVSPGPATIVISPGSSTVTLNANLQLGLGYNLFALGDTQTSGFLWAGDVRPWRQFARMQFVHGAPLAPAVDVYTSPPGPGVTPLFRSLTYFSATPYVSVDSNNPIYVTEAGTTTVLAELAAAQGGGGPTPPPDGVGTFVLADGPAGGPPFCIFYAGGLGGVQPCP